MRKNLKRLIIASVILTVIILIGATVFTRHYRNVFMEMLIFPEGSHGFGSPVQRFVIQNNGTFISYTGVSLHSNPARSSTIILPFRRSRIKSSLSENDFRYITEWVNLISNTCQTMHGSVTGWHDIVFIHDGIIYKNRSAMINMLADEILYFSPLMPHSRGFPLNEELRNMWPFVIPRRIENN